MQKYDLHSWTISLPENDASVEYAIVVCLAGKWNNCFDSCHPKHRHVRRTKSFGERGHGSRIVQAEKKMCLGWAEKHFLWVDGNSTPSAWYKPYNWSGNFFHRQNGKGLVERQWAILNRICGGESVESLTSGLRSTLLNPSSKSVFNDTGRIKGDE